MNQLLLIQALHLFIHQELHSNSGGYQCIYNDMITDHGRTS